MRKAMYTRSISEGLFRLSLTYELTEEERSGFFTLTLTETDNNTGERKVLYAPEFTSSEREAYLLTERMADGTVTSDSFYDIFEDFFV